MPPNKIQNTSTLPLVPIVSKRGHLFTQLGVPLIVLIVLIAGVYAFFSYLVFDTIYRAEVSRVESKAGEYSVEVARVVSAIISVGSFPSRIAATSSDPITQDRVKRFVDTLPAFEAMYFVDTNGALIWAVPRTGTTPELPRLMPDESREMVIDPIVDIRGVPHLFVHYPVFGAPGELVGHVISDFDLSGLWRAIVPDGSVGFELVDKKGKTYLITSNSGSPKEGDAGGAVTEYLAGRHEAVRHVRSDGVSYIEGWSEVEGFPWAVITWEPYVIATDQMRSVFIVIGFSFLIFSFLIWYEIRVMKKLLFQPLSLVSAGAGKMARGDLDVWVPIEADNELGALADTLNLLAYRLRSLYRNLEGRIEAALAQARSDEEESTRLNEFMVHREIKMAELKEEIKRLKDAGVKIDNKQ